jgi:hypothetical protein
MWYCSSVGLLRIGPLYGEKGLNCWVYIVGVRIVMRAVVRSEGSKRRRLVPVILHGNLGAEGVG